ncbi:Acetate kinase [Arthrobacter sp. Bi83]|nr:Acetate kinase [Arthrobacter sp. Bi83]
MPLLKPLGLFIDEDRNQTEDTTIRTISTDGSRCPVLVVPYDEERAIAEATAVVVISDDTANRSLNQ